MDPVFNQDILFNILLNSKGSDIDSLCITNKITNKICNDDFFWITKFTHDNIPTAFMAQPVNYVQWLKSYKDIKNSRINIEYIIKRLGGDKLIVNLHSYNLSHLLRPINHLVLNSHELYINKLENNKYEILYKVYYDLPLGNVLDDVNIFTLISTKKVMINLLTEILYLYPDINIYRASWPRI